MSNNICTVEGCESTHRSRGYCNKHYKRFRRYGDPAIKRPKRPIGDRFWEKVEVRGDCWEWAAGSISTGYGSFHPSHGESVLAHRWAYENMVGPIPKGLVIDHLCRNRLCVNPDHLDPVTSEENLRRGAGYALLNGMRSECINGHEYGPANTYIDPSKGTVRCRKCAQIRDRMRPNRKAA